MYPEHDQQKCQQTQGHSSRGLAVQSVPSHQWKARKPHRKATGKPQKAKIRKPQQQKIHWPKNNTK